MFKPSSTEPPSPAGLVAAFTAAGVERAKREAERLSLLADASDALSGVHANEYETAVHSLLAEFAVDARMSEGAVGGLMSIATAVRHTFTATGAAFAAGELSLEHVRAIVEPAHQIAQDHVVVGLYEQQIVEFALGATPRATRLRAQKLVDTIDPDDTIDRHRKAREQRHVRVEDCGNGMGELIIHGPMILVRGAYDRASKQAKALAELPGSTDPRTRDQIRCDLALDMLLASDPETVQANGLAALKANISVTLDAKLLSGDAFGLAEHDGFGALDPETALELAGLNPIWTKLFLDHEQQVISTSQYTPTMAMRRTIMARDVHCRFPGCRMPATAEEDGSAGCAGSMPAHPAHHP